MTEIFRPPLFQVENSAGVPLSGAKLYVYEAGTTTLVDLWQDDALSTPQANPAVADANGMFPAFWLDETSYKVVLTTSADVPIKTVDNITPTGGGGGGGGSVFADNAFFISGSIDDTKLARFEVDGLTTATTRVYTLPDKDGTVAMTTDITTAVNAARARRNLFDDPGLQLSTVNGTTSGTTNGYEIGGGWKVYRVTSAGTITGAWVASTTPAGAPNRNRITITVADASLAAGEYLIASKTIMGRELAHLNFGTASALQTNLRFLFKGPSGTYAYSLQNTAVNRSYVGLFTPASANTDEIITANIAGDQSGTWPVDTSLWTFNMVIAAGSTFQGTTGWQNGNILGTSAVSNGMGTGSAVFEFGELGWHADPQSTGVAPVWELPSYSAIAGVGGPHVIIEDQKTSGTSGGTSVAATAQTRTLNTKVYDPFGLATLASNEVTLPPGRYEFRWSAPGCNVDQHQTQLYGVTDAAILARGSSEAAFSGSGAFSQTVSFGSFVSAFTTSKAFSLRHYTTSAVANGLGQPTSQGGEVYARLEITKVG